MLPIKLYRHALSGHSHRVEVFLSLLGLESQILDVDLMSGAHKQADFLNKNIFGQVPVIEDGENTLSDSNAILVYLASKYDKDRTWLPENLAQGAQVQRFLSVAASKVAYGPALARLGTVFGATIDTDNVISASHALLAQLNAHLAGREWLVTDLPTIADVANYTYIAHAPEGNVSLEEYANVKAWVARFENLPHFVPMQSTAVGLNT
ncbi:glutathione S-transferase family protein [Pseudoalteromonas denitrificans]|uniref:Glutathione S-transferase n=1 Tax=Pseudoalteromonas denitrificans DSM 6059 TaxID=1123010 RepID=A0A1I1I465_9GAMM|nr:glutathione S-transferase [Pseudoalteromonas denitrificans]SFC31219.1 glutathione S-transferase [Pseudoalteromonas denitrificans DSM 6059]